jgi:hypothetical protein
MPPVIMMLCVNSGYPNPSFLDHNLAWDWVVKGADASWWHPIGAVFPHESS